MNDCSHTGETPGPWEGQRQYARVEELRFVWSAAVAVALAGHVEVAARRGARRECVGALLLRERQQSWYRARTAHANDGHTARLAKRPKPRRKLKDGVLFRRVILSVVLFSVVERSHIRRGYRSCSCSRLPPGSLRLALSELSLELGQRRSRGKSPLWH